MKTKCEECDAEISVPDDAVVGEIVSCRDCGSDYEVVELGSNSVSLKAAETIGEDWGE